MAQHYDPVPEGGITMAPIRFSERAAVSHEHIPAETPAVAPKKRAPRKPKEG